MSPKTICSIYSTPRWPRPWYAKGREHAGHYAFAHALIQRSLYEGLGPTRRARVHRRVGEALEQLCGVPARDPG